ncbi:phosphatidylinositol-specific phospholipase C domain-containing protein [Streptomyces sp. H27-H5]|uniref:phosphatidylinositol-specific phospholipase C domain-containing protein n=1 Tax=Streptomyces sp. H27-H5 TaxID=2996460 RepID=UPI00226F81AA|nr:phosphatidylinositol-specific phospholipase C domain-containing protein [Streptomyces sp. H27-H5]MCY0957880.1 phosphatidylinositol-specific phospholipase C domain-containing protein [Streptomyces sp. H27-H5]
MPRTIPHAAGAGSRRRSRPLARLLTVCVALGAALLTPTAAGAAGSTNQDAHRNLGQADRAEWMWGVASDTKLSAMSIPGTHDTLAIHGGSAVQTQEDYGDSANTLTAQLERGIRAIDIRVRAIGGSFTIHHSAYYQQANFDDVLKKAQGFLKAHPTETIVMRMRAECAYRSPGITDCANEPKSVQPADVRQIFAGYVGASQYRDLFHAGSVKGTGRAKVPTLGDVRGKLVLAGFDNVDSDGYGIEGFNDHKEDTYNASSIPEKWNLVKTNVDAAISRAKGNSSDGGLYVTYTSANTVPGGGSPLYYAGGYTKVQSGVSTEVPGVNYHLMKYLNSEKGRVGIVMTDFPGWGLVNAIIDHNEDNAVKAGNRMIWQVNSDKTYVNSLNGRCMVRGPEFDSSKTGGLVTQRVCQSTPPSSHQWGAEQPPGNMGKGYHWIKASNGKCLTVPYNNGTPPGSGTQLFWWDCETRWFSGSQMWNIIPTKLATATGSRPAYTFINNWTGLCLSMDPATADTSGGKVTQETCPKK